MLGLGFTELAIIGVSLIALVVPLAILNSVNRVRTLVEAQNKILSSMLGALGSKR